MNKCESLKRGYIFWCHTFYQRSGRSSGGVGKKETYGLLVIALLPLFSVFLGIFINDVKYSKFLCNQ